MNYDLELNPRPFHAIKAGTKKIEVRTLTRHNNYLPAKIKMGDRITFIESETAEEMKVVVIGVRHYSDARALLETEGTERILSSGSGLEQGIKNINNISGYDEAIKKHGIYAIEVELEV